ncbi:MAG TPA: von Willebrand factor type A domain-containing protein [Vicinamibacterales bacterium]|nr:von Willebrand factor type A domain-containing protein [Vicinamibacterales bacterium]
MRRFMLFLVVLSLAASGATALVGAQRSSSTISGTAKDPSGGVLPGVTVQISSEALSGVPRTTVTDSAGQYRFAKLPAGMYSVKFSLRGFTTVERTAFQLPSDFNARIDAEMRVGSVEETITVTGGAPVVDVQSAARVDTLDRGAIDNIPNGKTITGIGQLNQGIATNPPAAAGGRGGLGGSVGYGNGIGPGVVASPSRTDGFNTEAYDRIEDNQWADPRNKPLSTFSIDVDTASYANVRRFLISGQLPPRDAVRIEEMINYFSYDYDAPRERTPFSVTTSIGDCPWNPSHRLALIGLQAQRIDQSEMPPRNLVFLVDVSGSMQSPTKLPLVKSSLAMLAQNLTARDRIAIVVYAGAAGVVLPSTEGNDRSTVLEALGRLQAGGSTNGAQGIQLAYRVARQNFIDGAVNRVVLATDGDFNVGVTNQGDLIRLIEENRQTGISLSVLGYGMGNLKDSTMEKLADKGNGNYSYIDSLEEARKVLVHEAGGTLVTVAKDVKLQIEFNPRTVGGYRLIGYENRVLRDQDFNDDRKDAGDMGAGHSVTALYEIAPVGEKIAGTAVDPLKYQKEGAAPTGAWQGEAMTVKLRYKQPDGDTSSLIERPVPAKIAMSNNLGFASAVAEFGMLLRDSEFKGAASFDHARRMAEKYRGSDLHGHRTELIGLIEKADALSRPHLKW